MSLSECGMNRSYHDGFGSHLINNKKANTSDIHNVCVEK